jgi:hypothetical protein
LKQTVKKGRVIDLIKCCHVIEKPKISLQDTNILYSVESR